MTSSEQDSALRKEPSSFTEIKIDLLGFAFHPTWIYLLFYSNGTLGNVLRGGGEFRQMGYYLSAFCLACVAMLGVVATKRFMIFALRTPIAVSAPLATAAGTFLLLVNASRPSTPCLVMASILTGVGSAFMAARWAALFGRFDMRAVISSFPILLLIQVTLCLSVTYFPQWIQEALLVSLPLISGVWLMKTERRAKEAQTSDEKEGREQRSASVRLFVVFLSFVASVGFVTAFLGSFGEVNARFDYGAWFDIAVTILTLAFTGFMLFSFSRQHFPLLFLAPLACLLVILLPQARFSSHFFADVAYPVGTIVFELLLLFVSIVFARMQNYSPAKIYLMTRLVYAITDTAGWKVGNQLSHQLDALLIAHSASMVFISAIGSLAAIAIAFAFMTNKSNLAKAMSEEAAVASQEALLPSNNCSHPCNASLQAGSIAPHDVIATRCKMLEEQYGLSQREGEVLILIAEGRSSSRIQQDLSIAAGTANYHTRNIYAKLGVHSRQEVIDLALGIEPHEAS